MEELAMVSKYNIVDKTGIFWTRLMHISRYKPSDFNECTAPQSVCDVNANCQNIHGSYLCTCKTGFIGDGRIRNCSGESNLNSDGVISRDQC